MGWWKDSGCNVETARQQLILYSYSLHSFPDFGIDEVGAACSCGITGRRGMLLVRAGQDGMLPRGHSWKSVTERNPALRVKVGS